MQQTKKGLSFSPFFLVMFKGKLHWECSFPIWYLPVPQSIVHESKYAVVHVPEIASHTPRQEPHLTQTSRHGAAEARRSSASRVNSTLHLK
jgi:hypothetical protein